ncbi:recombinase family protein [Glycomyces sp. NPDC046736]|uniref:recombinase family protein n=1 Tax=Glycomyces sp. NPDC046736 TaxID=3155615 RepID=UPI003403A967
MAFLGRTSTYDQQDPTLSIPRQLRACQLVLPQEALIVAHFYDVESGRKDLVDRGKGGGHTRMQIPVPRDGGVDDLLEEARRPDRRFDVVICEDIGRAGRRAHISTEIEHQLEEAGVQLIASDEPFHLGGSGRRPKSSTQVLTRRMKQGVAEWYVIEMLEKAWGGFEMHTEQGYNVGKPCYGYRAKHLPHPVPAKRDKGIKKSMLEVHPVEGPVVQRSFNWRITERLGYQAIADRLNEDPVLNPPPTPVIPSRAVGCWTSSNVRDMITNPKHTGHMVWNRRARKGKGRNRANPVEEWVWSPEPVHEPLVSLEDFVQAQEVAKRTNRSRSRKSSHQAAKNEYPLRSFVFHEQCGRRMFGNQRRESRYHSCSPKPDQRPDGHPHTVRVREDVLLDGINTFLAAYVLGPYRKEILQGNLSKLHEAKIDEHAGRASALEKALAETEAKLWRLGSHLESADELDEGLLQVMNQRSADLRAQQQQIKNQLADLAESACEVANPDLIDELPISKIDLHRMPVELARRLFEALRLTVTYDHATRNAVCQITLIGETIRAVQMAIADVIAEIPADKKDPHGESGGAGLCGAPGRIRTCDTWSRKSLRASRVRWSREQQAH